MPARLVVTLVLIAGCAGAMRCKSPESLSPDRGPPVSLDVGTPADAVLPADPGAPADPGTPPPPACKAPAKAQPTWYDRAVGYEVFVRSFQDSDGDGTGDLKGLTSRLDYLNDGDPATDSDLGVDLIWLMPITESPSYHGYDTTDYAKVDEDYGTDADFDAFVQAAHARGIRVIIDFVANHSSRYHPWFADSSSNPQAAKRDWYVWADQDSGWTQPWSGSGRAWHKLGAGWYYGVFSEGMPDLNYKKPAVRQEMTAIANAWLDRGLDGFRLDAVRYLIEEGEGEGQQDTLSTHQFWAEFRAALAAKHPEAMLVGEAWANTGVVVSYFGTPQVPELHMAFDFDTADALMKGLSAGRATETRNALCARLSSFPAHGSAGTFLSNHDQERVATAIAASGPAGRRLAAALLVTLPGTPWLYYGEEIGMRNGATGGDEAKRLPMQWKAGAGAGFSTGTPWMAPISTAAADSVEGQAASPDSLLSFYKRMIRLRGATPPLAVGSAESVAAEGTVSNPLALLRQAEGRTVLAVYNLSAKANDVTVPAAAIPAATAWKDLFGGTGVARASTSDPLALGTLDPWSFRLLEAAP